jgi:hypothetical protein
MSASTSSFLNKPIEGAITKITWATLPNTTFGFKHYEELLETWMGLKHLLNG